jgi:hypothetical protein
MESKDMKLPRDQIKLLSHEWLLLHELDHNDQEETSKLGLDNIIQSLDIKGNILMDKHIQQLQLQ